MLPLLQAAPLGCSAEAAARAFRHEPGLVFLSSSLPERERGRFSFVAARPFLTFASFGSRCEFSTPDRRWVQYGNPWHALADLMARYETLEQWDHPFPLGGCFGYWGYELKNHLEPKLRRHAVNDLELPDSYLGFYDTLAVFDHYLGKEWIISTGLRLDGTRCPELAKCSAASWYSTLERAGQTPETPACRAGENVALTSSLPRDKFIAAVRRGQEYIRAGDIYQVNVAQRLQTAHPVSAWDLFGQLSQISPAPFAGFLNAGDFQLVSSSPELFLKMSGSQITTRPIKGTRPRSADPTRDAQLSFELQTSSKETAELIMITDLLRNDLGRVCDYGSICVPELARLERFAQVHHLVSTVTGRLRAGVTHDQALARCFPGGSVTGAPKIRAMEIIDELEPVSRGPYTGSLGYLGFNGESQLNIIIRTAISQPEKCSFYAGAGIVADSEPEAEFEETMAKAAGFCAALQSLPVKTAPLL